MRTFVFSVASRRRGCISRKPTNSPEQQTQIRCGKEKLQVITCRPARQPGERLGREAKRVARPNTVESAGNENDFVFLGMHILLVDLRSS